LEQKPNFGEVGFPQGNALKTKAIGFHEGGHFLIELRNSGLEILAQLAVVVEAGRRLNIEIAIHPISPNY
jgi:hypothetical protein